MKKNISALLDKYQSAILIALMLCFTVVGNSQVYQNFNQYGGTWKRLHPTINLGVPNDTFAIDADHQAYPHIVFKGDSMYVWSPTSLQWRLLSTTGNAYNSCEDKLLDGGRVIYSGTGLKFYITAAIYRISCVIYTTTYDSVTLSPSDPDDPRKDVIYLATTGVEVLEGTPAGPAAEPQLSAGQIKLTVVDIQAGATTPGLTQNLIYDENTGESVITGTGATPDPDYTTAPYHLLKAISFPTINLNNAVIITLPSTVNLNAFDGISAFIRLKAQMLGLKSLVVCFFNGATQVSNELTLGINKLSTDWQGVSLSMNDFTFSNKFIDKIRIRYTGSAAYAGFDLDFINFDSGLIQPGSASTPVTIGPIDTKIPSPNGMVAENNILYPQSASQTNPGLMSPADKTKLDSLHSDYFIENIGDGEELATQPNDSTVGIKSLKAGTGVTLEVTDTTVTINSSGAQDLQAVTDIGNTTTNALVAPAFQHGAGKFSLNVVSSIGQLTLANASDVGSVIKPQAAGSATEIYLPDNTTGLDTLATLRDVRAGGGSGGTNNANVGAFYRWLKPDAQEIKTFANGYGNLLDSISNTNAITIIADTASADGLVSKDRLAAEIAALPVPNLVVQRAGVGIVQHYVSGDSLYLEDIKGSTYINVTKASDSTVTVALAATGTPDGTKFYSDAGSWLVPPGALTMAAIGATPNANGASISAGVLTLQPASTSFGGVVTTTTQSFQGQKTMSAAFFPTGGLNTNTTAITSNLAVAALGAATSFTSGILGGTVWSDAIFSGSTSTTMNTANPFAGVMLADRTAVENGSGVHDYVARLTVRPITLNNAGATTTEGGTITVFDKIGGTATITKGSSAIWVKAGDIAIGTEGTSIGRLKLRGNTSGEIILNPAAAAGTWTLTLPTTDGNAGDILKTDGSGVTSWTPRTTLTKNATIENPTASENIGWFRTPVAITVTNTHAVLVGSSTPSVTYQISFGTDITSLTNVYTAGQTVTSTTTGTAASGVNDATIPADSWIRITTSAQSGTVGQISLSITFTED